MSIDTWLALIGVIVSLVSFVVGFVAHDKIKKLKNEAQIANSNNSNINQYQGDNITINEGIDAVKAMELAISVAKIETQKVEEKLRTYKDDLSVIEQRLEKMPTIHIGNTPPPKNLKNGDIWFQYE